MTANHWVLVIIALTAAGAWSLVVRDVVQDVRRRWS